MEYLDQYKSTAHEKIELKGLSYTQIKEIIPKDTILIGYRGSIAHGTYLNPDYTNGIDDKDIMGVYVAPQEHYFGFGTRETYERKLNEWDTVHYEVVKFIRLLLKGNPNVLMMLWLPEKYYIYLNPLGWAIIGSKDIFVSKNIYHSFTGYAYSQLKRMEHMAYDGYMGEKRKRLVDQFGYDTKNASHLIRLLRMGIEFLVEGKLHVEREDASQLIDIKNGKWSLEKVKDEAEKLFVLAKESYVKSKLPNEPDTERAEKLAVNIVKQYYGVKIDGWDWGDLGKQIVGVFDKNKKIDNCTTGN